MTAVTKNILIIVVIIIIITAFYWISVSNLNAKTDEICARAETIIDLINNEEFKEAEEEAETMRNVWEKWSDKLSLYIDHADIESIGINIDVMESFLKSESYFDAKAEAKRVISKAQDILKREFLTWENIF